MPNLIFLCYKFIYHRSPANRQQTEKIMSSRRQGKPGSRKTEKSIKDGVHRAYLTLVSAMRPCEVTTLPIDRDDPKRYYKLYYELIIREAVKCMFNLDLNYNLRYELANKCAELEFNLDLNYNLRDELANKCAELKFNQQKINVQMVRILRICKQFQHKIEELETNYILEVGSASEFYECLNTCYEYIKNLEFDASIFHLMRGYSVKDTVRDVKLTKWRNVVYTQYAFLRTLYYHPDGSDEIIRGYPDYNGCVEDMKPADMSQFIQPGRICKSYPTNQPIPESVIKWNVDDFNRKLAKFNSV